MTRNSRPIYEIVVFMGATASGKSFLASRWAADNGFPYFNTDVVRKSLAGLSNPSQSCSTGLNRGVYTAEFSRRTYEAMQEKARTAIVERQCECVVLDGSYLKRSYREQLVEAFKGRRICFVYCFCSEQTAAKRLAERAEDSGAVSDGTMEVYRQQQEHLELPSESEGCQLLKLDTDQPVGYLISWLDGKLTVRKR